MIRQSDFYTEAVCLPLKGKVLPRLSGKPGYNLLPIECADSFLGLKMIQHRMPGMAKGARKEAFICFPVDFEKSFDAIGCCPNLAMERGFTLGARLIH